MRCAHCFVNRGQDHLTSQQAKQVLDDLYQRGLFLVYYTFGEPLLYPDLLSVIEHGQRLDIAQVMMTNGYYLTSSKANELKNAGITNICVSLDSIDPVIHDRNRGVPGAFYKAVNAIQSSVESGVQTGIGFTVTDRNEEELSAIEALGRSMNVSYISFLRERRNGHLLTEGGEVYRRFALQCFTHIKEHPHTLFHDVTLTNAILEATAQGRITPADSKRLCEMNQCHCGYTLSIAPDGSVSRCNLSFHEVGNINKSRLADILGKEEINHAHFACCPQFSKAGHGISDASLP